MMAGKESAMMSLASATSAATGGLLSCLALYPLEMLKALMSIGGKGSREVLQEVGGLGGLYKGVEYKCSQVVVAKFIYFYTYTALQEKHKVSSGRGFTTAENLLAGYVSDLAVVPLALPIECVVTSIQKSSKSGKKQTLAQILHEIHSTKGIPGFYAGVKWQLLVSMLSAIQQTIFDQIRAVIIKGRAALSPRESLLLGALARLIALIFVYPFMRLKTVMQASDKGASTDIVATLKERPSILYNGFAPEALRGVLSSALLYLVKEQINALIMRVFLRRALSN